MNNKFIFPEKLIKYEVHEFMRFDRFTYDLPVDVFVDICGECRYNEHLLVIYFRNSYDREEMNFAPMSVDDNPTVLCDKTINLYNKDIIRLKLWVKKYRAYIKAIDEKKCTWKHLFNVAAKNHKKYVVENIDLPIYDVDDKVLNDF